MSITAILRLGDEREYIRQCIQSIAWMDNLVFAFQNVREGDPTPGIVETTCKELGLNHLMLYYPYESRPNGPGHSNQPYDEHNRAYFYNWTYLNAIKYLEIGDGDYLVKWDGDMVALPELEGDLRGCRKDTATFCGIDIVQKKWYDRDRVVAYEPRMFRFQEQNPWTTGLYSEAWNLIAKTDRLITTPRYLHFKWSKEIGPITRAWPDNWHEIPHFINIMKRGHIEGLSIYKGRWPDCQIQTT